MCITCGVIAIYHAFSLRVATVCLMRRDASDHEHERDSSPHPRTLTHTTTSMSRTYIVRPSPSPPTALATTHNSL